MRITGGVARGISLVSPKGDVVRPATDQMRQAVFSSLGGSVINAQFVDLFAGTGAYGLEAVSRGASGGVFVEKNPKAISCLRKNLEAVCKSAKRDPEQLIVSQADATTGRGFGSHPPDLIFVDPPYEIIETIAPTLFEAFTIMSGDKPDLWVVFEMPGEVTLSVAGWECVKRLGRGARQPSVCFFRKRSG